MVMVGWEDTCIIKVSFMMSPNKILSSSLSYVMLIKVQKQLMLALLPLKTVHLLMWSH